ncbi:hypothetical protein M9Y10_028247 [Tritrichomonas musculus]|uniref:Sm domain-containing protein n=1 Tax=Tritrichomonas musculus TaxID=1915356 RepID=A0ABR2KJ92_9EUKA
MSGLNSLTIFLQSATGHPCIVSLTNGTEITGTLCTIDGFFNLVLKDAKETATQIYGQQPNTFKSVFIRGSNVIHITPVQQ